MNIFHKHITPTLSSFTTHAVALISLAALMSGCNDEPVFDVQSGELMQFNMSLYDGWYSRGEAPDKDVPEYVGMLSLKGDFPADTLFIHTTVTNGIHRVDPDAATNSGEVDTVNPNIMS